MDWWYPFIGGVLFGSTLAGTVYVLAHLLWSEPVKDEDDWLREFFMSGDGQTVISPDEDDGVTLECIGGPCDGRSVRVEANAVRVSIPHPVSGTTELDGEFEEHMYRRCWDREHKSQVLVHEPLLGE